MNKWISVKDRFPLYKECILVYLNEEIITEAVYLGENEDGSHIFRIELTGEYRLSEELTHWMVLPEPPENIE